MRIQLLCLSICLSTFAIAQTSRIRWLNNSTFDEVKTKAKKENKYIFIDCFTTWCGPCKAMDKNVFPLDQIGQFMNENFISLKIQMDNRKKDLGLEKHWDSVAASFEANYKVNSYPCFLFLSPNGTLVHKGLGYRDSAGFMLLAKQAVDTSVQLYSMLSRYQARALTYDQVRKLSISLREANETNIGIEVARGFMLEYLFKLDTKTFYSKDNLLYMGSFCDAVSSKDRGFKLVYAQQNKVDRITGYRGFAQALIDNIITREEISVYVSDSNSFTNHAPKWARISARIRKKYNKSVAERNLLNAQIQFYRKKGDWPSVIKYTIAKLDKFGIDTAGMAWQFANNAMFEIFKHSNDVRILNKAIKWMEIIINAHPNAKEELDTYANLLYKVGRKNEAIHWQEKAAKLEAEHSRQYHITPDKIYEENLEKMRNGEPTWMRQMKGKAVASHSVSV